MLAMLNAIYGAASPGNVTRSEDSAWMTGFTKPTNLPHLTQSVYHRFYDGEQTKLQLFYPLPRGCYG